METTKAKLDEKSHGKLDDSTAELGVGSSSSAGLNSYLVAAGLACSLSPFVYGYNISVVGDMSSYFKSCTVSSTSSKVLPDCIPCSITSWTLVVAAFCFGGLIGALSASSLADRFGRKKVLFYHNLLYILGTLLLALAPHPSLLILGRLFIGIASGICTVTAPTYLSEISTDKVRGILGNMFQAAIVIGIFVSQVIGLGIPVESGWRILFGIGGVLPLIQMALIPFFVESPKWLAKQRRDQDCIDALKKLRKGATPDAVHREATSIIEKTAPAVDGESFEPLTVIQLIKRREASRSLIVGSIAHACQQFSFINAVFYFGGQILDSITHDNYLSKKIFVLITVWNILMTAVSVYLIDRSGRRPLILISALIMTIADVVLVLSTTLSWEIVGIVFMLVFVGGFAVGLGPVPWTVTGDIFPPHALGAGSFICVGVNWVANTIVAMSFEYLEAALGSYVFIPAAAITASFFVFALKFFPETRGKSPAFIQ